MTTTALMIAPVERRVNQTVVRLIQGDLTALEIDAFVHYAREDLELGSGYGTAIQSRGGGSIRKELEKIGSLHMGEAAITAAGAMAAKQIIHACGPKFQEADTEGKLRNAVEAALRVARDNGVKTLAFPPMGTGFYGVPLDLCARVMVETIRSFLAADTSLEEIVICVVDRRDFAAFQEKAALL